MKKSKIMAVICALSVMAANAGFVYAQPAEEGPVVIEPALEDGGNTLGSRALMSIFKGGDGSAENPFLIENGDQLAILGDAPTYCYQLVNDIELEGNWTPIGSDGEDFTGVLDGNGYAIKNLSIDTTEPCAGLFNTNAGTIKNLRVQVKEGDSLKVVYLEFSDIRAGILAGKNQGTISSCGVYGKVEASTTRPDTDLYCGGLVGYNAGTIENSYARCDVTGKGVYGEDIFVGGMIGCSIGSAGSTVKNNYAAGKVTANATSIYGGTTNDGGFIGSGETVTNCYYDKQVSGLSDQNAGSLPKSTLGLKTQATFTGWDFESVWAIDEDVNDGYPYIKAESNNGSAGVTGITLSQTAAVMGVGDALELKATIEPEEMADKKIVWSSSDPGVTSVSNGTVTAKSVGETVITAAIGDIQAECAVTVSDDTVKVESVLLDKSDAGIGIGETVALQASVLPQNATNPAVKWTSMNPGIASVTQDGIVTGVAEGTTQIYATSQSNSGCYAVCNLTVAAQKIPVTGVELDSNIFGDAFEINIGKTITLTPTIKPANATNKSVKWTSSDTSVASVVNGVVTGLAEGQTTVTATTVDGGYTASCPVKVTKPTVYVKGISFNVEQLTVDVKSTKQLKASVLPADATDKAITFESNNNAIATISEEGIVKGISPGTTLVKAISKTSAGTFVAFCVVTVPKPVVEATSIKLDKGNLEIVEGKTVPLKAVIKPANTTYKTVAWSAGDESIATVSQDGKVTARGVGETVVSATTTNGKVVHCNIKVLPTDTPAQLKVEDTVVKAGKQVPITVSIASNPGISTFTFDLTYDHTKMYPVSYTKGDALSGVEVTTPLGSQSFQEKDSVRFLCKTADTRNTDVDGELVTVVFQTLDSVEQGIHQIGIIPSNFINENNEAINLQEDGCQLEVTDYIIGDVNGDDVVDLKDAMLLAQSIAGFDVTLTEQGRKAAIHIYPDGDEANPEPSLNDLQHLFRYLSDWQVELGKK